MAINKDTKIEITLGKLFALFGSILSIFLGFYLWIIKPDIDEMKANDLNIIEKIEANEVLFNGYFIDINNSIGRLNGNVEGLQDRFGDLRDRNNDSEKSSGSF
jgi:hypothetical protein